MCDQQGHRRRRGSRGGRPPAFDAATYKGRNVIERRFCHLKQWRGLATRYDKLALTYRAAAVSNGVIAWTRRLSDMPSFAMCVAACEARRGTGRTGVVIGQWRKGGEQRSLACMAGVVGANGFILRRLDKWLRGEHGLGRPGRPLTLPLPRE